MAKKNTTIVETKIPVDKLELGMFVSRLDKEWVESSFAFQGFMITDQLTIKKLQKECEFVYVDQARSDLFDKTLTSSLIQKSQPAKKSFFNFSKLPLFGRKDTNQSRKNTLQLRDIVDHKIATNNIKPPTKLVTFDVEMKAAKEAHHNAANLIHDFMAHVKQGGPIDIIVAKHAVYDCMASMLRTPDAMLLITRLKNKSYNLWQHSMNVSVLAISLGRYLNLHDDELVLLGLCGLFHDIGKLRISKQALDAAEDKLEVLNAHPLLGRDILLNCMGQLAEVASEVAYNHHEHLDGTGFPNGLIGDQISPYCRMIAIVNLYDNLTTDKPDRKALTHYDAMTRLLEKANQHLDATLVNSFNRCIGTYPVGCVVEMNTGEIAVVVEDNDMQRLRPKILLLTDENKTQRPRTMVNLAETLSTRDDDPYYIKAIVRAETYGIKL
jgi:HD-GYP domain-containing protein (c-di-GMP phosphodiesterase class II)